MATVPIPNSLAARKTRMAISLRFATSSLRNGRATELGACAAVMGGLVLPSIIEGLRMTHRAGGRLPFGAAYAGVPPPFTARA
jgi:hypothetical protein